MHQVAGIYSAVSAVKDGVRVGECLPSPVFEEDIGPGGRILLRFAEVGPGVSFVRVAHRAHNQPFGGLRGTARAWNATLYRSRMADWRFDEVRPKET